MGLIKTVTYDKNGRVSLICVEQLLGIERGKSKVEVHVENGDVKIKKKEIPRNV